MRRFLKPFFSKKIFGILFFILQLVLLIMPVTGIYDSNIFLNGGMTLIAISLIIFEINRESSSGFKLIWIALIGVVPLFGIFLYIYVHSDLLITGIKKNLRTLTAKVAAITATMSDAMPALHTEERDEYGIFRYLHDAAYAPCFNCCDMRYFRFGEEMFDSLMEDIKSAKKYIFIEFFIINESDYMWKRLFELLKQKASQGIEVRLMYDAMGSLTCTSKDFDQKLRAYGIKCVVFSPVKPFVSTYHNNRDHRKIVIIDGRCAYTGGVNIADEYINSKVRFGHWKDTAIRIDGEGVKGFLLMYFKIWDLMQRTYDDYSQYLVTVPKAELTGGYLCAFDDTPMDTENVSRNLYMHIINTAKDYVYINTPYLILDDELLQALKFAARRGVDVRICMPHIPDKWYAFALARTYYPELMKSGVKIYEYTPGFLHAKSTISDDIRGYIGSANYDYRSLYLHYECGVYIYKNNVIKTIKTDFTDTLKRCKLFTQEDYRRLNIFYRMAGRIFRFFASLM